MKNSFFELTVPMIVTVSLNGTGPVQAARGSSSVGQEPSSPYTVPKLMVGAIPIRESPQRSLRMIPMMKDMTLP